MVIVQQSGQISRGHNPLTGLRTNFWYDQLGFLAISANVANGNFESTEPVSMTGVSYYPRLYYSLVGIIANLTGLPTVVAWNLTSFTLQVVAVAAIGMVAASILGRWWAAFFAPLPFFTGTFSYVHDSTSWYTSLQSHAVLWGPYGVLFSNNAETAGICIGIVALSSVIWVWSCDCSKRTRAIVTIASSASIGVLSSFQTYSFLMFTYCLVYGTALAVAVYVKECRRQVILGGAFLVIGVFLFGPHLADRFGQLPTLFCGLLPAFPGIIYAVFRTKWLVAVAGFAAVATAAPQVVFTLSGIFSRDPFLTYRVASNNHLGIFAWESAVSASAIAIPLFVIFLLSLRTRDKLATTITLTALLVLPFLAVNDLWGANAEPYRFWIEGFLVGGIALLFSLLRILKGASDYLTSPRACIRLKSSIVMAVAVTALFWGASLPDWINSMRDSEMQASWNPFTERESAISEMARKGTMDSSDGLIVTDGCIDNRTAKVTSGSPFAYYHLGMAWPSQKDEIDNVISARADGSLDLNSMDQANVVFVLTDSACSVNLGDKYKDNLTLLASDSYRLAPGEVVLGSQEKAGQIMLWRVVD
ncbi:MAG: hypothetical protein QM621_02705 [Aeromicrobium sp.]|uniref:hypothetical protein n=1 Tax=Aeromicrobium sp. TaxID=1871063 RepID=UPI0039E29DB9